MKDRLDTLVCVVRQAALGLLPVHDRTPERLVEDWINPYGLGHAMLMVEGLLEQRRLMADHGQEPCEGAQLAETTLEALNRIRDRIWVPSWSGGDRPVRYLVEEVDQAVLHVCQFLLGLDCPEDAGTVTGEAILGQ